MSITGKRLVIALLAGMLAASGATIPAADAATSHDATSAKERKRVDSVTTPTLDWYKCYGYAECATTKVPLDYDQPKGKKIEIAVLRVKATDQKHKIGSLFVNPGGPGSPGTDFAYNAPNFLSPEILARFDIVGFDPRGMASSTNVRCFRSVKEQNETLGQSYPDPLNGLQAVWIKTAKAISKACSSTGKPLTGAMSTAEVARDMDVLRRAVGDKKLNYLGFSYGSAIGQYYANMFPDRFRALAVDGIIDPQHWAGTKKTANQEIDTRVRSGAATHLALMEILNRCRTAGITHCVFADGDPVAKFETMAAKVKVKPVTITDPVNGAEYIVGYGDLIGAVAYSLYGRSAGADVTYLLQDLWTAMNTPGPAATAKLSERIRNARSAQPGRDFTYYNELDSQYGVICSDALHPADANQWPALMAAADKKAPHFGPYWGWRTAPCARNAWTVRDEDAYRGPWNKRTAAPVLFVGTKWDPATNYDQAVSAQKRLPNSGLLSNTNWGHVSYGSSACVTTAIDTYLLKVKLPKKGTNCVGDVQPFTEPLPTEPLLHAAKAGRAQPPVSRPLPPSILIGTR